MSFLIAETTRIDSAADEAIGVSRAAAPPEPEPEPEPEPLAEDEKPKDGDKEA